MAVVPSSPTNPEIDIGTDISSTLDTTKKHVTVQISDADDESNVAENENYLVVSPYDEKPHLLDLRTLDTANQILAKALIEFKCLREDYATAPYVDTFNWLEVIDHVKKLVTISNFSWRETEFYIVVFRSRIPPTTACSDLGVLDKAAHAEATKSGGFLRYWFGSPDGEGRNLATCVWRSQEDAKTGSVGEHHRRAAGATRLLYTEWRIERLRLIIKDDVKEWEIIQWAD